jgi:hypothetical protein
MSGPQSQLDELGSIRGLITDATKDTALWLQANPSAEGRVHVLAIQERLANLARIIERRMERRSSPNDGGQWPENVAEVLSLLGKAGEVRGHIVGKGLARFAERVPRKLTGSKIRLATQSAPPPKEVGGLGIASYRPMATHIPPDLPPYYPNDLKPQTHLIIAEAVRKFPDQTHTLELCRYVISDLTPHFRAAVQGKTLRADLVFTNMGELLHYLLVSNCDNDDRRFRLEQEARKSDEWLKLSREVVGVAADDSGSGEQYKPEQHNDDPAPLSSILQEWEAFKAIKQLITGPRESVPELFLRSSVSRQLGIKPEDVSWNQISHAVTELLSRYPAIKVIPSVEANDSAPTGQPQGPVQEAAKAAAEELPNARNRGNSNASDRRAAVDAYIVEVFDKTGRRITRTDIWKTARYKSRTEFERWQRKDPNNPNKSAHERFTRILAEKPHVK